MKTRTLVLGLLAATAAVALVALVPTASASTSGGFGVTPVELKFVDPPALRGSHLEGVFKVQNRQGSDVEVTAVPDGAAASWMRIQPAGPFVLRDGETREVRVIIDVPQDAANGDYATLLRIRAAPASGLQGSGSSLGVELVPAVRLRVGGEQTLKLAMDRLEVKYAEAGSPLQLSATLVNQGNVRATPYLDVTVKDADGATVFTQRIQGDALEPRAGGPMTFTTAQAMPGAGTYTVRAVLGSLDRDFGEKTLTFNAIPRGSAGEAPKEARYTVLGIAQGAEVGSPAKVTGVLKNTGLTPIQGAKLVAELYLGDKLQEVQRSDALSVAPGEEQVLEIYFTPKAPGAHRVVTHILYDNMKTGTKSDTLQVQGSVADEPPVGTQPSDGTDATPAPGDETGNTDADPTPKQAKEAPAPGENQTPGPGVALLLGGLAAAAVAHRARRRMP